MIKLFALFVLVSLSAGQSWNGTWSVISTYTSDARQCPVPENGTVANITSLESNNLQMKGHMAFYNKSSTWILNWTSTSRNSTYCNSPKSCQTGVLSVKHGAVTYANISWVNGFTACHVTLAPVQFNWLNDWYVASSDSNNMRTCQVPAPNTQASISQLSNGTIAMYGINAYDHRNATWHLGWSANQSNAAYCNSGWCAYGNLSTANSTISATINWKLAGANDQCSTSLVLLPNSSLVLIGGLDLQELFNARFKPVLTNLIVPEQEESDMSSEFEWEITA